MTASTDDIYEDLKRQYDLVADRRKVLTGQAVSIMGFAGIIDTVLIALMVSIGTDNDVRMLLSGTDYYPAFIGFSAFGFISYVATAIFALLAYWEPLWILAPETPKVGLPNVKSENKGVESIRIFWNKPQLYHRELLAYQLQKGVEYNQKINDKKYDNLRRALISLLVGIAVTTIGGIILLSTAL
jgi:hypothetical protein